METLNTHVYRDKNGRAVAGEITIDRKEKSTDVRTRALSLDYYKKLSESY